jgi:hypothetical protein
MQSGSPRKRCFISEGFSSCACDVPIHDDMPGLTLCDDMSGTLESESRQLESHSHACKNGVGMRNARHRDAGRRLA